MEDSHKCVESIDEIPKLKLYVCQRAGRKEPPH